MANTNRQDAQHYLERLLRDLSLSTGDHYNARAVAEQAKLFLNDSQANKGLQSSHFYAIASLVERCVYRALNIDTGKTHIECQMNVRRKVESYDDYPSIEDLLEQEKNCERS